MASNAIIIGAGPAGLTAAYELAKLGVSPTVLEADQQVGGISRTVEYRGYRFDIGGHRFFTKVPLVNELWREILGDEFLLRDRMSRIHYGGHFFDYPLKATNALAGLGVIEAALVCASYASARCFPKNPGNERNFEQWVSNRFGERLYRIFFKTYTEKVWGIPCSEISADWAAQRIKNLSLTTAVRNALFGAGRGKDGQIITTLIDQFHYPRLGPGMMWERCEEILAAKGHRTERGMGVERLLQRNGRIECVYARDASGASVEFSGDHFISSMPLRELIQSLDPPAPAEVRRAAEALRYRDYLTVVLMIKRADVFPDNWIYIHSPEVRMGRIQNYKNWSPHMVPDASRTSLGLEYFLWESDEEWTWPDERLIERGVRECAQIGIIDPSEVEDGTVVRMKKAYPIYDHAYRENVEILQRYLAGIENLQTVGRNGLHRYNNQDHSMLTAVYAARNIIGEKHDVWAVNTEEEYHEETSKTTGDRATPTRVGPAESETEPTPDELIEAAFARIDAVALGAAIGLVSGISLFAATSLLLLMGGPMVGRTLSLLGHFLLGFEASWAGAFIGLGEAGLGGFLLGYGSATARNWGMAAYAHLVRRRAEARERRDLLDRI